MSHEGTRNGSEASPEPMAPAGSPGPDGRGQPRRFPIALIDEIELDDGPEWLIQGLLPAEGLHVLYGVPGTGKSFVALDAGLHVAAGRPWMGRSVRKAGVVYVAAEAGRGLRRRIVAARRHHALPRGLPFALIAVAPRLGQRDGDARLLAGDIAAQLPDGFRPGLIIIDTLARTMAGCDESGSAGMGIFIESAETLGRELGALVMAVHHSGKDLDRGMRGSSALLGAADAVWRIVTDEEGARTAFVRVEKMKEGEDRVEIPFSLARVDLEPYADGEPRSSCVVVQGPGPAAAPRPADPPAASPSRSPSSASAAFLQVLATVIARHGAAVHRFKHIPREARVIRQADLAGHPEFAVVAGSAKSRRTQIDRQVRTAEADGLVCRHGGYLWLAAVPTFTMGREKQAA